MNKPLKLFAKDEGFKKSLILWLQFTDDKFQ